MTLAVGDRIPDATLHTLRDGIQAIASSDWFAGRTVLLFAVPGAFTPTCSSRHLPGYVEHRAALRDKGIERIGCMAVNDAFVMDAWARTQHVPDDIDMLADGNGAFATEMGLETDARAFGMGIRAKRFALIARDGVVTHLFVDAPGEFRVSAAEHVLAEL